MKYCAYLHSIKYARKLVFIYTYSPIEAHKRTGKSRSVKTYFVAYLMQCGSVSFNECPSDRPSYLPYIYIYIYIDR